ncbi:MAG: hypothetical protein AB1405_02520 [Bdellovibrionota bacterium]
MNAEEIRQEIRKNLESVSKNVEGVLNYLSGPEFRTRAEEASKKLVDLATTARTDALKLAQDVSEKALSDAKSLQKNVTERAMAFVSELQGSVTQILSSVRGSKSEQPPANS